MTIQEGGDEFEFKLRQDLRRGMERRPTAVGRDRGVTARWLKAEEMTGEEWDREDGGFILGRREGRVVGWNDDRHLLTIAGSRAGKGVSLIIPNLIHYKGSAVVIDPKGENAARTARHRAAPKENKGLGQKVYVLDPFGESGIATHAFNPLAALDPGNPEVVEDIGLFADALITHPDSGERHWTESAQALIRALILLVVTDGMFDERRNLITVRRLLTLSDPAIDVVMKRDHDQRLWEAEMKATQSGADGGFAKASVDELTKEQALIKLLKDQEGATYGHICSGMAAQLEAMGSKERGSVLSSARTQTQWLDSPMMPQVLEKSDFKLGELKTTPMTVYLCLPATRMSTHSRWLRLMVMLAIGVMERVKAKPKRHVLFVLDEFAVLGNMQSIETAAGLMAGFGVKLWPIVQNIGQLKKHYPTSWETFIANAGCITAFGIGDSETLKVLSDYVGTTAVVQQVDSGATRRQEMEGVPSLRDDRRDAPLLAPHELRLAFGRRKQRALVFNVESDPAVVKRFTYYADSGDDHGLFGGRYDPDPNYSAKP